MNRCQPTKAIYKQFLSFKNNQHSPIPAPITKLLLQCWCHLLWNQTLWGQPECQRLHQFYTLYPNTVQRGSASLTGCEGPSNGLEVSFTMKSTLDLKQYSGLCSWNLCNFTHKCHPNKLKNKNINNFCGKPWCISSDSPTQIIPQILMFNKMKTNFLLILQSDACWRMANGNSLWGYLET